MAELALQKGTEEALRKRCMDGDDLAWRELFGMHFPRALAIAAAPPFMFDRESARDIAQDAMMEVAKHIRELTSIGGFVARVVHNRCVDAVRRKKPVPFSTFGTDEDEEDFVARIPGASVLPDTIDDSRTLATLRGLVEALGEPCYTLVKSRYFDELSYAELAGAVAVPEAQVGVYLSRCMGRLRLRVGETPDLWKELAQLLEETDGHGHSDPL